MLQRRLPSTEADEILESAQVPLSEGLSWRYLLSLSFEELAVVADRHHLKPLLPLLAGDHHA